MSGGNIRPIIPMMQNINMMGMGVNPNHPMQPIQSMQMSNQNINPINPVNQMYIGMNMNMPQGMPMPHMFNPMMMGMMNQNMNMNPNLNLTLNKPVQATGEFRKVWVGHIPPNLSDTFMLKLLESCGTVAIWKRTTDQNGRPKGFGICEYHTVDSMLKALRLLNHLKLEEGYELSIKVDSKTEDFLKQWREQKKQEWIDNLKRRGVDVNLDEIKKRESNGEPLEWELQLISKDNETRKIIFEILTQKNEIEMYAKQNEKPEEFLKDLKDLTTNNPFSVNFESEREKEREKKKNEKIKKIEKQYKEEEKKWERHEEDREKDRLKDLHNEDEMSRRKKRFIEKDFNYDSEEEKRKIKQNFKKIEEKLKMREKEREFDNLMRRKENPNAPLDKEEEEKKNDMNDFVTDIVLVNSDIMNREPEPKTLITYKEYDEGEEGENEHENEAEGEIEHRRITSKNITLNLNLNLESKKNLLLPSISLPEEDYDPYDPYHKKKINNLLEFEINPETEKEIMEINKEHFETRKYEEEEDVKMKASIGKNKNKFDKMDNKNISQNTEANISQKSPPTPTTTVFDKNKVLEIHKQIYELIPKNTEELLKYPIMWNIVYKYDILENKIKPWLGKKLMEYIGEDEPNLKAMIIKKLVAKCSPYELMDKIKAVFEEDTEVIILLF